MRLLGFLLVAAVAVTVVSATNYYCPRPHALDHGRYRSHGRHSSYSRYGVGHVIYYECDYGYELYGHSSSDCYYDRSRHGAYWRYPTPVCKRRPRPDCGSLPNPTGGVVKITGTSVGSVAKYRCNEGYILVGDEFRRCLRTGKWSGEAPVCKLVDCGPLDNPDYGEVEFTTTTFRSKATYSCNDGFFRVGVRVRVCQANGKWSDDEPVCKPVDCGRLRDPPYGDVDFTTTTFRSKAFYSCDDGFFLVGERVRECQANGKWSNDEPVCKPVDCGPLEDPDYGDVDFTTTTFGSKATYSCDKGFFLVGRKFRFCQANGKWSGDEPVCKPVDCGRLRDPPYGDVDFTTTTFRSKATYSCDKGFFLVGDKVRECQANGKWSGDMPVCKPVDCGNLPNPDNGFVRLTGTTVGSRATYVCKKGFNLVGDSKRVCQANGKWSGDAPVCRRRFIDCGRLRHPPYGRVSYHCTYRDCDAYYSCNHGYYVHGSHRRVCQYDGYWSDHEPSCRRYGKKY